MSRIDATVYPYPLARRSDVDDVLHGTPVPDPYRWLENGADAEVRDWEDAQQELWAAVSREWGGHQFWRDELRRHFEIPMHSVPKRRGGRLFFTHRPADAEHSTLIVREPSGDRRLIDVQEIDPDGHTLLDAWQPSWDGRFLAYQLSHRGTEDSVLRVMDVSTGMTIDGPIDRVRRTSIGWLADGLAFYYVRRRPGGDEQNGQRYGRCVYLHRVGELADEDIEIVGSELDSTNFYTVSVTSDGSWLTITATAGAAVGMDLWIADLRRGSWDRPVLVPVHAGLQARTTPRIMADTARTDPLWMRTDLDAPRGRVVVTSAADPRPETWRTLIETRPDAVLRDFAPIRGAGLEHPVALVSWTTGAVAELSLHDLTDGRLLSTIDLPGDGEITTLTSSPGSDPEAWFRYSDHVRPPTVFTFDARTRTLRAWPERQEAVTSDVRVSRSHCLARDGSRITVFVMSPGCGQDRPRPTILTAYGGFGISMTPTYLPSALAWVRAGGVFAVACLRGGGEGGEEWHRAGTRVRKQTVFDDFDAAADHLIQQGWAASDRLGILGESNGGLLVSAALTQHPEKYAAAVCLAPLTDMIRYERFGRGRSWRSEYGTVEDAEEFRALFAYSPYHAVRQGRAYPPVMFGVGENDTRVDPLHARKMCAALQDVPARRGPVLLRVEREAGHGARAVSKQIGQSSDVLTFFARYLGLPGRSQR